MSKFKPKIKQPKQPKPAKVEEEDDAAKRLRISESRRVGRRASILADVDEKEAKLASVNRPEARLAKLLLGE